MILLVQAIALFAGLRLAHCRLFADPAFWFCLQFICNGERTCADFHVSEIVRRRISITERRMMTKMMMIMIMMMMVMVMMVMMVMMVVVVM